MCCTCTFVAFFSRGRNPFVIVVELFRVGWAGEQFNNIGIYFDVQISISLFNACKFCSYGHSRDLLNLIVQFIAKKQTNKQPLTYRMQSQQQLYKIVFNVQNKEGNLSGIFVNLKS